MSADLMGGEDEPMMPPSGVLPRTAGPRPLQRMPHEGGPAVFATSHRNIPMSVETDGPPQPAQRVDMRPYSTPQPQEN